MPNSKYDPKLSKAGFMDLAVALQARLDAPDAIKVLEAMPCKQREAAEMLVATAKSYVQVVETQ